MKKYIDVKMTVWQRFHFAEEAYMKGIADIIKEDGLDEVIDEKIGFQYSETLFDTEERMEPLDNDNSATVKVFEDGKEVWNNEIKS